MPNSFQFPNSPYQVTVSDDLDKAALSAILDGVLDDAPGQSVSEAQSDPVAFLSGCGIEIDPNICPIAEGMSISDL